jgi:shikimate dehydrogenase
MPIDPALLGDRAAAVDLIYHPLRTGWLEALGRRGVPTSNGLSMLVHQAAAAFERWTGHDPPLVAMEAAAREAVAGRSDGG